MVSLDVEPILPFDWNQKCAHSSDSAYQRGVEYQNLRVHRESGAPRNKIGESDFTKWIYCYGKRAAEICEISAAFLRARGPSCTIPIKMDGTSSY